MDQVNCNLWFKDVFLPAAIEHAGGQQIALVWDNLKSHNVPYHPQVSVFKLPAGVTSLYQPLDQGIILSLKRMYRTEMLAILVKTITNTTPTNSAKGLQHGAPANLLDVAELIKQCWGLLTTETIVNCFAKSTLFGGNSLMLLEDHSSKLSSRNQPTTLEIQVVTNHLQSLKISATTKSTVANWLNINEDEEFIDDDLTISDDVTISDDATIF